MRVRWDEAKRQRVLAERDIDFAQLNRHLRKIPMPFSDWILSGDRQPQTSAILHAKIMV